MALNIRVDVQVGADFNSGVSSHVDNRIELGDRAADERLPSASNLQGDLADTTGGDDGGRAMSRTADSYLRRRHLASLDPTGGHVGSSSPSRAGLLPSPTSDVDAAIRNAAPVAGVDVNTMRSIASIESSMNPASNRNRATQYKGLYQLGRNEWGENGAGDVYNAGDNAMAAGRLFASHRATFRSRFGREPTDRELYMMHQQGLGFYTRGAMTNIAGNPYPGMSGPQTHDSFEAGWGREVERRKEIFARRDKGLPPKITLRDIAALSKR